MALHRLPPFLQASGKLSYLYSADEGFGKDEGAGRIVTFENSNHALELSYRFPENIVTHNYLLLPEGADRLRFKLNVTDVTSDGDVLQVFLNKTLLSTIPLGAPAIDIGQLTQGFEERELLIPETIRQAATKNHGEAVTLTFQLMDPVQGRPVDSIVYVDDIRVSNAGQAIQAEIASSDVIDPVHLTKQADLDALIDAAQAGWTNLINTPNWGGGVSLRTMGVPTAELPTVNEGDIEQNRDAGSGECSLNDQSLFADLSNSSVFQITAYERAERVGIGPLGNGLSDGAFIANQVGGNSDTPLSTNSHAIQSQDDSLLLQGEDVTLINIVMNENISLHSEIADGVAAIDGFPIASSITNINLGGDFSAQGSDGAIADLNILDLKELPLCPLENLSPFGGEFGGFVEPRLFSGVATGLGHREGQNEQEATEHDPSFGSPTLPPDRKLSNEVAQNGQCPMVWRGELVLSVVEGSCVIRQLVMGEGHDVTRQLFLREQIVPLFPVRRSSFAALARYRVGSCKRTDDRFRAERSRR
ncbi:MAG: hypothetical protein OEY28_02010 [Nitrospira sp.]|nr:hypothetical protein [Nitrospira sp.]